MTTAIQSILSKYSDNKEAAWAIKIAAYDYYSSFGMCKNINEFLDINNDAPEELFELYTEIGKYIDEKDHNVLVPICKKYVDRYSLYVIKHIKRKAILGHILNVHITTKDDFYGFLERTTGKLTTIQDAQELYKLYSTLRKSLEQE